MCCKNTWKRFVIFAAAFMLSLSAVNFLKEVPLTDSGISLFVQKKYPQTGTGISGSDKGLPPFYIQETTKLSANSKTEKIQIFSKPLAGYTYTARQNKTKGTIRLRVNFLKSGEIGSISPINNLPDGLTEQAILAAKQIKFKPATRNGNPLDSSRIVEYNFAIY